MGCPQDRLRNARILIVDDEPHQVAVLEAVLNDAGYARVHSTTDSRRAVDVYRQLEPDLLLLDLHMLPVDGYHVLAQLQEVVPEEEFLPALVLTGDVSREAKERALALGARDFVAKPFGRTEVLLRIKNLLEMRLLHRDLVHRTRLLRGLLGRYLADPVVEHLLADTSRAALGGRRLDATVLFADLRGFTELSESLAAEAVLTLLNRFLSPATDIVLSHGGMLDKFPGDGVMAVFGVPDPQPDDALRAVEAALAMQSVVQGIEVPNQPGRVLQMGIGINSGPVVAGNIGSERRHDFTVVGDTVNVAARFESSAGPGQILITDSTYQQVRACAQVLPIGTVRVKGKTEWVSAYQVVRAGAIVNGAL